MAEKTSVPEPNTEINKLVYVIRDYGSYGGWRTELLVEEITERMEGKFLLCNNCGGVLRDACLFKKDDKHKVACSLCIPKGVSKEIAQLNRETVNEKQVKCPLKGCDWTNELSELLHHLEECELFPVACPLECRDERGEVNRVERRGVETHRTRCPMRTVKCEYCIISMKACDMNGHLEVCKEFPIPCPNKCSAEFRVKRKEKSIHLSQECPLRETECPYSQYGCEAKVQRINLERHEKEDIHKHMKLAMGNIQSQVITLEKENEKLRSNELRSQRKAVKLEEKNEELRTRIVNIEMNNEDFRSSLRELKGEVHKHMKLTMENIQSQVITLEKENKELRSNELRSLSNAVRLEGKNEELRTRIVDIERNNVVFRSSLQEWKEDMHKHMKLRIEENGHLKIFLYLLIPIILIMMVMMISNSAQTEKSLEFQSCLGTKGNLEWKISGVKNKISENKDTLSDPFNVGLYKFQARIQWNEKKNAVGLFLHIMKGEWDDALKWPIRYKYSLAIINQLDANDNYVINNEITHKDSEKFPECFSKPTTERNGGFGYPEFISHADLFQEKYSKDDSMMLKISVELIFDAN